MSYTIGIGVLLGAQANNRLREVELLAAEASGNLAGLGQPPHITVKIPFEVTSLKDVEAVRNIMCDLASKTSPFDIQINGYGNFGDKVIYGAIKSLENLTTLSNRLINELTKPGPDRKHERARMVFHSTIAMNLAGNEFNLISKRLEGESLDITTNATSLGLFMGIDSLQHWSVIHEAPFVHD